MIEVLRNGRNFPCEFDYSEPETDSSSSDEEVEPETDSSSSDEEVEPETDSSSSDEEVEPETDSSSSDEEVEPETDSSSSDEEVEPETDSSSSDEEVEPETDSSSSDEEVEPETDSSSSDEEVEPESDTVADVDNQTYRQYPQRIRIPRQVPGAIPWNAIDDDVINNYGEGSDVIHHCNTSRMIHKAHVTNSYPHFTYASLVMVLTSLALYSVIVVNYESHVWNWSHETLFCLAY